MQTQAETCLEAGKLVNHVIELCKPAVKFSTYRQPA